MPAISKTRSLASAFLTGFTAIILAFTDDLHRRGGISERQVWKYQYHARHFLIWLELTGIELRTVDGDIIDRFLQHDCRCAASCAPVRLRRWRKRRTSPRLMAFIHYLEQAGDIETAGELYNNLRLLDAFLTGLRDDGYATASIKTYRRGCTGLLVWLHLSRIRLCNLTSDVYARFLKRQFVCSIPGVFRGHESQRGKSTYEAQLRDFLRHLVSIGRIAPPGASSGTAGATHSP